MSRFISGLAIVFILCVVPALANGYGEVKTECKDGEMKENGRITEGVGPMEEEEAGKAGSSNVLN